MAKSKKTIEVDGVQYVRADSITTEAPKLDGMKYVIVRSYDAGCFAGYLESKEGQEVKLRNARRLWYWDGAASLSQLAMEGTTKPENCKFPCEVSFIELNKVCEVIDATEQAQESINSVAIWKK